MELIISKGCEPVNKLWIAPLNPEDGSLVQPLNFQKIFDTFDAEYDVLCNEGSTFYIKTNCGGAKKYKVVKFTLEQPEQVWLPWLPWLLWYFLFVFFTSPVTTHQLSQFSTASMNLHIIYLHICLFFLQN